MPKKFLKRFLSFKKIECSETYYTNEEIDDISLRNHNGFAETNKSEVFEFIDIKINEDGRKLILPEERSTFFTFGKVENISHYHKRTEKEEKPST